MPELDGARRSGRSSWSCSARLSLALSALCCKHTGFTCSETQGEEQGKLLVISVVGGLAFWSC